MCQPEVEGAVGVSDTPSGSQDSLNEQASASFDGETIELPDSEEELPATVSTSTESIDTDAQAAGRRKRQKLNPDFDHSPVSPLVLSASEEEIVVMEIENIPRPTRKFVQKPTRIEDLLPLSEIYGGPVQKSSTRTIPPPGTECYKGHDGYAPIAAYLGREGWCMACELRPGSQHANNEFIHTLDRILPRVRALTDKPVLVRLDSAHDAAENRQ